VSREGGGENIQKNCPQRIVSRSWFFCVTILGLLQNFALNLIDQGGGEGGEADSQNVNNKKQKKNYLGGKHVFWEGGLYQIKII